MSDDDRLSIMAAIIAGARLGKFDRAVTDETIAADAVRIARAIDQQVRTEEAIPASGEPALFRR